MTDETINSVLWHALEKAGDKLKDQKQREALEGGSRTPVDVTISGEVDGVPVATAICGHLQVAHDGTTSTKVVPPAAVCLAIAMSYITKTRRQVLLDSDLVAPDERLLADAEGWVEKVTLHQSKAKRGAVSFEFEQP